MSLRLLAFALGLAALGACSVQESKPAAGRVDTVAVLKPMVPKADSTPVVSPALVEVAYSPAVDSTKIHSWSDYDAAKTRAFLRKDSVRTHLWMHKDSISAASWKIYSDFEREQAKKLRAQARSAYNEWLDAEKWYEFNRIDSLKKNSPEFREFSRVIDSAQKVRYVADKTAQQYHEGMQKKVDSVYTQEIAIIERVWRGVQEKEKGK